MLASHTCPSGAWLKQLRQSTLCDLEQFGDDLGYGDADKLRLLDEIDCLTQQIADLRRQGETEKVKA